MEENKNTEQEEFYLKLAQDLSSALPRSGYIPFNYNQFQFFCPDPKNEHGSNSKPKLSVNFELDVFRCWVCRFSGRASNLLQKYNILKNSVDSNLYKMWIVEEEDPEKKLHFERKEIEFPKYRKLTNKLIKKSIKAKKAYKYLQKRLDCDLRFITRFELGIASKVQFKKKALPTDVIFIPSFDSYNNPNYYFYREYIKKYDPGKWNCLEDKKNIIFLESHVDWNRKHLVLVEGPMDSLKLWNYGVQNVPMLGTSINEDWLLFQVIKKYGIKPVIFLDQFADNQALRVKQLFRDHGGIRADIYAPWEYVHENDRKEKKELDPASVPIEYILHLKEKYDV